MGDEVRSDSRLIVTLKRNRFNGSEVALSSLAASSNQNVKCNKRLSFRCVKSNKSIDNKSVKEKQDCDALCINDNEPTEIKLSSVLQQVSNLTQDEHIDQVSACNLHLIDNCDNSELRFDRLLTIYWKVLGSLGPLEARLNRKNGSNIDSNLLELRLRALRFIENLDGYCNSISMLRLILKSPTFTAVMFVHDNVNELLKNL